MTFPLYCYDGTLACWIDNKSLRRLQDDGLISRIVKRRKGPITRAVLHRMPGEARPITLLDYVGTRYSFRQNLADGHHCFRLRALGDNPRDERELAPSVCRPIFLRVVLDCLVQAA
jgi:hypothetical protein